MFRRREYGPRPAFGSTAGNQCDLSLPDRSLAAIFPRVRTEPIARSRYIFRMRPRASKGIQLGTGVQGRVFALHPRLLAEIRDPRRHLEATARGQFDTFIGKRPQGNLDK